VVVPVDVVDVEVVDGGGGNATESVGVLAELALGTELALVSPVLCDASSSPVAHATPGVAATAIPTPNASASAPTRPM
jgi:hypothetical protein